MKISIAFAGIALVFFCIDFFQRVVNTVETNEVQAVSSQLSQVSPLKLSTVQKEAIKTNYLNLDPKAQEAGQVSNSQVPEVLPDTIEGVVTEFYVDGHVVTLQAVVSDSLSTNNQETFAIVYVKNQLSEESRTTKLVDSDELFGFRVVDLKLGEIVFKNTNVNDKKVTLRMYKVI